MTDAGRSLWTGRARRRAGHGVDGVVLGLAMALVCVSAWPAQAGTATESMKTTIDKVLEVLHDKDLNQPKRAEERRQRLEDIVSKRFDYEEMSKRSLGSPWKKLSAQDQQEFVRLFRTLLSNTYADRVETYSGEGVQYLNERGQKGYAEVRTKVVSGKAEIPMDYRLLDKNGDWKVYDVVVNGISLVSNYRKQFDKILQTSSTDDLLQQLREKSKQLQSP